MLLKIFMIFVARLSVPIFVSIKMTYWLKLHEVLVKFVYVIISCFVIY